MKNESVRRFYPNDASIENEESDNGINFLYDRKRADNLLKNGYGNGDTLKMYLVEATRVELLSSDEEVELAKRIEKGKIASQEISKGKVDGKRLEKLELQVSDGTKAEDHLVRANTRLVVSVANKYKNRGMEFLDLIQEGNIGLIRAAKKYDYKKGFRFSTYATWWIRQSISRAVADQGRTIRVPVHMSDQINRMTRTENTLKQDLRRDPTVEELAESLEISSEKVIKMKRTRQRPISLEQPIGLPDSGDTEELGNLVEDKKSKNQEEHAEQTQLKEHLDEALADLPPREVRVLKLRYGLDGDNPMTLKEVGQKLGVTRERVRQLENQAFRRLRAFKNRTSLLEFLNKDSSYPYRRKK